ncbi:MAG: Cof-type HAD-IIB family hydrolase [Bacillaceae bacterium]|nr:Cof-type HAD-IIB family hydrolase [Bacillaceae bacterium]
MKIIATDMDGTLLDHNRELTEENARAIVKAQERGVTVVVATGRDYTEAVNPLKRAGIRCPIIAVNGAEIRSEEGEKILSTPLTYEQIKVIKDVLTENNIYFEIYTSKGAYTNNHNLALQVVVDVLKSSNEPGADDEAHMFEVAERRFQNAEIMITDDYEKIIEDRTVEIHKALAFTIDDQARNKAREQLMKKENLLSVSSSGHENLEITNVHAQKGIALQAFADRLGVSMEEVMAIGDNFNDMSMLEVAGVSVAMENAEQEVKDISTFVTKTNDESGVAYAINKYLK